MSAPAQHETAAGAEPRDPAEAVEALEAEVVDGVAVLEEPSPPIVSFDEGAGRVVEGRSSGAASAMVQAAAAAAGGFVAGAAVLGLVHRRQRRFAALARAPRPPRALARRGANSPAGGVGELVQIVGTRSLLVDVHLLANPSSHGSR